MTGVLHATSALVAGGSPPKCTVRVEDTQIDATTPKLRMDDCQEMPQQGVDANADRELAPSNLNVQAQKALVPPS